MNARKDLLVNPSTALPGREAPLAFNPQHYVNGRSMVAPFPDGYEIVYLGLGCFWGAERLFWQQPGVYVTAVGYAGGYTPNATYKEVCSGQTGHAEIVMVVFDPSQTSLKTLLKVFWEAHDPTQGMRQGNDIGTQYRSAIYATSEAQLTEAQESAAVYGAALRARHLGPVTTEI